MTSYNENQSTSSFSQNIILVHSNIWKTDENLDQNNSTPSSFAEQVGNGIYDNAMGEQDELSKHIQAFESQNLSGEENENGNENEENVQNVEQNNNINDNLTSEKHSLSKRKRKRGEKKPKKRGAHDYYIKTFLSDLLNNFVLRKLNEKIKNCKFITIKKVAQIKKCNYKINIEKQIQRTLKVFVDEKTVEEIFYSTNKELFDDIKKEYENFQNPDVEEFLNYIKSIMEPVIKEYYHSKELEEFKNKVTKKKKRSIKEYDEEFRKGRGYSLLEAYNFIYYARSKPYSQKERKKNKKKKG